MKTRFESELKLERTLERDLVVNVVFGFVFGSNAWFLALPQESAPGLGMASES